MLQYCSQSFLAGITDNPQRFVFLKCLISVIYFISFIVWNACSCSSLRFHSLFSLSSDCSGAQMFAKLGINRFIWFSGPIRERGSLTVFGSGHSVFVWAIQHFFSFNLIPASSSVFRTSSTFFMRCCFVSFVTISMSSLKANVFLLLCSNLSIIF